MANREVERAKQVVGAQRPDFRLQNEGTISIFWPESEAAQAWVDQHIPNDATRWAGKGIVVEHRYVSDILFGILNDGLEVVG